VNDREISKVENYLRTKFSNSAIRIEARVNKDDSAEVMLAGEFIGVLFKDVDEGETSYDLHMSILELDLD
jgi:hypothetical protein